MKIGMKFNKIFIAAAVVATAVSCVKEQVGDVNLPVGDDVVVASAPRIVAELDEPATRTCIDASADAEGTLPMLWMPSDEVGVFTSDGDVNVRYVNDEKSAKVPNASFSATANASGTIEAVYYPYSADNNGKSASALVGTIPAEQVMGQTIAGDYKYGTLKGVTADGGHKFKFHNLFSLIRFNIDATGTPLAGQTLETVTLTVTHDGAAVPLTGGFTFSALDGTYASEETSKVLTTTWNKKLEGTLSSFASAFPTIRKGDKLNFEIKAGDYVATLTVTSKADFAPGTYYTFPLTLSKFSAAAMKFEKVITGTFKAATYNVKSSTKAEMGTMITNDQWDFFGLSEDFSNLKSNLGGYTFGKRSRSTISLWGSDPKDGLGFATRNGKCSFSGEYVDEFEDAYGGLLDGANTVVDKGFRYYLVTMSDGVQVDVIITHMNTYDTDKHLAAQHSQLKEIATWIKNNCGTRPVVFMGDTNLRYTRHDFETYFWSVIRKEGLTYNDPWVDYQWDGVYPEYPSRSLMVSDATGTNSETDIICSTTQNGEVVDKVIYINYAGAATQIKALNYLRDMDYSGLSDHMPIVVDFSYTSKVAVN